MPAASPNLGTGPTNQQGPSPQTGSTTPTGQVIGPLPASTMPGQLAQSIPVMANFQFLLAAINNLVTGTGTVTEIDTTLPIIGGPIKSIGTIGHAQSGVVPGVYGDATHLPQITADVFGHVTSLSNIPISGGGAFIQADYVTFPASNAGLTSDRLLTAGTNITITDGGAKGPVTIAASGGGTGLIWFGDGSDGSFTADGAATPAWATRAGSVYTMTRNAYLVNLTVNSGVSIGSGGGFQIWCNGTLTGVDATSIIHANGPNSTSNTSATPSLFGGLYGHSGFGPGAGSAGGNANGTAGGNSSPTSACGPGGAGGNSSGGTGGAGGINITPISAAQGSIHGLANPVAAWTGNCLAPVGANPAFVTGGGGGGGAGNIGFFGGGGGAGAFIVGIFARFIAGVGSFQAKGGNASNPTPGGNAGGGGGGAGGIIFIITETVNWNSLWSTSVTGGLHSNGIGGGTNGTDGSVGLVFAMIV